MSLNVTLMRRVARELYTEIELTFQMQTHIRLRLAVADPAKLEELRSVDRELSTKIEFAVKQRGLIRLRLAIAEA
jgi:hypothetical protein